MRFRSVQCLGLGLLLAGIPALATTLHHSHKSSQHVAKRPARWTPGQREIDPERTRSIQQALISRNYLTGEPSGSWDGDTEAAMQKFQSDNGWQTKLMPDSRALIKLGLGPNGADGASALAQNTRTASSTGLQQATNADSLASVHSILN